MQIGMVRLGRMGMNMTRRLLRGGHEVVAHNRTRAKTQEAEEEGAIGVMSLEGVAERLSPPRAVCLMLPAGTPTEETITTLSGVLPPGDILIDGGNTHYLPPYP